MKYEDVDAFDIINKDYPFCRFIREYFYIRNCLDKNKLIIESKNKECLFIIESVVYFHFKRFYNTSKKIMYFGDKKKYFAEIWTWPMMGANTEDKITYVLLILECHTQ